MIRILFWFLTTVILFGCQIILSQYISIHNTFPDFLLLGAIYFSLSKGPVAGEVIGFSWGLLADVASISVFGSQAFLMTLIGYLSGRLKSKIYEDKPIAQMALVFAASMISVSGVLVFESVFRESAAPFAVPSSFLQPVYSTLITPVFFFLMRQWATIFGQKTYSGGLP